MCKTFKEFKYLLQIDPNLLNKDIEGFKTYEEYKDDWIYEWNKDVPWVDEKPWNDDGVWTEPTPIKHYFDKREELGEIHELPVCNIRRFEMIKYSFGQDEDYVAVKEDEYDDLGRTNDDALRMTKVIKGEFEKLEDLMVKDVSLTCDTSLEVFNNEFNRISRMDNDLFTYEVEVANIPCDSNKDDDSEK
ncbi:hypothetical protein Tco_1153932 [Tanacetum coccineum]